MTAPADRGPTHVGAGGDVTALAACAAASDSGTATSLLIVGVGSQLHVLDGASGHRVACATVLPHGARVHGVRIVAEAVGEAAAGLHTTRIFVHGDRWLATWRLAVTGGDAATATLTPLTRWRAHSWVHDVLPLQGGTVAAVGTADNAVTVVRVGAETDVATFSPWPLHPIARCDARGVLYSMALTLRRDGAVWAAAGTAFLDVVLWRVGEVTALKHETAPTPTAPAAVLAGHTGSIHRVAWAPGGAMVASASDDRSVRVWRVDETGQGALAAMFAGHGARLWDVAFLTADLEPVDEAARPAFVASACEDGAARVWALAPPGPTPAATLRGHTGRGMWRLAATHGGTLITAGADGTALAWRVADFLEGGATRGRTHDHVPWPPAVPRPAVSCLAPFAGTTLLVGAGDGAAWRVDVSAGACPPWHPVLPPDPARGSILSLDAAPCWRCGSHCVMVLAGCGRGHAALACDRGGAVSWPAAPPAPATTDDRLPPLQRVCLPAAWGGRVAVTASTLGDVRLWRVAADTAAPPTLLAAAPPRRARRRDATVAAITATQDLLFVADAAGGVAVFRVPDAAPSKLLTPLARATTPGATAATCIALGRAVAPPGKRGGDLQVRVGDAAGRVSHWVLSLSPPALARCGGDRAPFPVVTFDGTIGTDRVLAGFRGDDWCAALPARGGGSEAVREPRTGGWRRPAALLPGDGAGTPPTLIWSPPSRAGDAPGLAMRRLGGGGGGGGPPPRLALPAGHGLDVWAGVLLPGPGNDDDASSSIAAALATAGEDGAVVVTRVAPRAAPGGLLPPSARAGGLLDGASLRALTAVPDPDHPGCWLLFAAGAGGGGVTAWRGWWSHDHDATPHHHFCTAWAASSAAPHTNARVAAAVPRAMGVAAVAGDGGVAVFVALSTGTIVRHLFSASTFHPPTRLPHPHAGAALCIGVAGATCCTAVVASGGTDGRLIVRGANDAGKQTAAVDRLHQSGILALSMAHTHTGFTVVTAGDDQAIGVVWLDAGGGCVGTATVAAAHASAVRGVWTDGLSIVSVALDRTLAGWRLPEEPGGSVEGPLWGRSVQVPAPVGVAGLTRGGRALLAVVGRGCQVWAN